MLNIITPEGMKLKDKQGNELFGVSALVLMENAGKSLSDEFLSMSKKNSAANVVVVCGKGGNGGDGFVAARHLSINHVNVKVVLVGELASLQNETLINANALVKMGKEIIELNERDDLKYFEQLLDNCDCVIDCIFGIGLKREITGIYYEIINMINNCIAPIISADVPSGIDGYSGQIMGEAIVANVTVAFHKIKTGLLLYPGREYAGEIRVTSIGLPEQDNGNIKIYATEKNDKDIRINKRNIDANKGSVGKVLIITGSKGMTGAGCLAAKAAYRAGAGLVYLAVPNSLASIYECNLPEAVTIPLYDADTGMIKKECIDVLDEYILKANSVVIGPGLGTNDDIQEIVSYVLMKSDIPVVIDADAINCLKGNTKVLIDSKCKKILTPHPGELSRLIDESIDNIMKDRIKYAIKASKSYGSTVILKTGSTVIATPDNEVFINTSGNPGMATAGSGDVLSGIVGCLVAQGNSIKDATMAGVYLHGLAGDIAAERDGISIIASDIVNNISKAIHKMEEQYIIEEKYL